MGVVNVTPDSFSDGGVHLRPEAAVTEALAMLDEGAAIVDVGGESTRPGSGGVPLDEELRRVVPVLEALRGGAVSIDTSKAEVARRALALGAELVNDVTALRGDAEPHRLLESLASALAETIDERFEPEWVRVRVRKPDVRPAGIEVEFAAVTAERRR